MKSNLYVLTLSNVIIREAWYENIFLKSFMLFVWHQGCIYTQAKSNSWNHMQIDLVMQWHYTAQKHSHHQLSHNSNLLRATLWVGVVIHLPMVQRKHVTQLLQNPCLFNNHLMKHVHQMFISSGGWECWHQMVASNWGQILATDAISQTEINGAWIIVLGFDWPHQLTHRG